MKRIISLILVPFLLLGLVACGNGGRTFGGQEPKVEGLKPKVEAPKVEAPKVASIEMNLEYNDEAQVRGFITASSSDGSAVWEYETKTCYVGQYDTIQEIGLSPAGYMFLEEGTVYCLDSSTGEVRWINEDFGGEGAFWDFDDKGSIYLSGAYAPWLVGIDIEGKTIANYREVPAEYIERGYSGSLSLLVDEGGRIHISSYNNNVLVIDPADGEVIDEYPYTEALNAEFLEGDWVDNEENPTVRLVVYNNLEFDFYLYLEDGTSYYYEGRFVLDTLSEEYSPGTDWLRTDLIYTEDPVFENADSIGEFIVNYSIRGGGIGDTILLTQINNGDSFISYHTSIFETMLYKIANPMKVIDGGIVDMSYDAPKVIESKDLTSLETELFYAGKYLNGGGYDCLRIKLERNEMDELILSETYSYNVTIKVRDEVLSGVQELIDKLELVKLNGTIRFTSALPPPNSPMYFRAGYASGESIYFKVDGNTQTPWSNELVEYILNVFAEYGASSVLPPRESVEIIRFELGYFDGIMSTEYIIGLSLNDEEILLKEKFDHKFDKIFSEEYIDLPENYYIELESLMETLKGYDLINLGDPDAFIWKTLGVKSFYISIEHADRSQDFGFLEGNELSPEMLEKIEKIMEFIDTYFEK